MRVHCFCRGMFDSMMERQEMSLHAWRSGLTWWEAKRRIERDPCMRKNQPPAFLLWQHADVNVHGAVELRLHEDTSKYERLFFLDLLCPNFNFVFFTCFPKTFKYDSGKYTNVMNYNNKKNAILHKFLHKFSCCLFFSSFLHGYHLDVQLCWFISMEGYMSKKLQVFRWSNKRCCLGNHTKPG